MTGTIHPPENPCESDDEKSIREFIASSDVHVVGLTGETSPGHIATEEAPGIDDQNKLWLRTTEHGQSWNRWSSKCGKWNGIGNAPGERKIRFRVGDTVADDMERYGGWQLANGSNILGVNLLNSHPTRSIYKLHLPTPAPEPEE